LLQEHSLFIKTLNEVAAAAWKMWRHCCEHCCSIYRGMEKIAAF